MIKERDG